MKKGFTLVEMLVVIGIIAVLAAASLLALGKVVRSSENAKNRELVLNVATALAEIYNKEGQWPKSLRNAKTEDGAKVLDGDAGYAFVKYGVMTLDSNADDSDVKANAKKLTGHDRFGLVTGYAMQTIRRLGSKATESSHVNTGGTIADHRLRYEIDYDGDGLIENVQVGGETLTIRGTAAVWCCTKEGKLDAYSKGLREGTGIYSWSKGQVVK